jgi:hypothetical protein
VVAGRPTVDCTLNTEITLFDHFEKIMRIFYSIQFNSIIIKTWLGLTLKIFGICALKFYVSLGVKGSILPL